MISLSISPAIIRDRPDHSNQVLEPNMKALTRSALCSLVVAIAIDNSAAAQEIEGIAEVRSANEIGVGGTTVHLYGAVAPRPDETCDTGERRYQCGIVAWAELIRLADGHRLSCDIERQRNGGGPSYATCYVGERDINESLVRSGWAEASENIERYRVDQEDARRARRGLWAGRIRPPDRRQAP